MNTFLAFNKWVGVLFGSIMACVILFVALDRYTNARQRIKKNAENYLQQLVEDTMRDLPPGLNGEYPADGPMADFYRENPTIDGSYIPVASP
jgi:hypothetical protein